MKPSYDIVVATVEREGRRNPLEIRCKRWPKPTEMDLLYVLCEQFGKIVPLKTLHERLGVVTNSLRVRATRLRNNLEPVWAVEPIAGVGIRIFYIGEQPKTKVNIDYESYIDQKVERGIKSMEVARAAIPPAGTKRRYKRVDINVGKLRAQQIARKHFRAQRMKELYPPPSGKRVRLDD